MEDELSDFESEGGSISEFEGDINLLLVILLPSPSFVLQILIYAFPFTLAHFQRVLNRLKLSLKLI